MSEPVFQVIWNEDSSATVMGRIAARDATGEYTGKRGEGNFIKIADLSEITYKVYDLDAEDPDTEITSGSVTLADSILDTPNEDGEIWTKDRYGFNFQHDLGPANFPTGGHRYSVEYRGETNGGTVFHAKYHGIARPISSS